MKSFTRTGLGMFVSAVAVAIFALPFARPSTPEIPDPISYEVWAAAAADARHAAYVRVAHSQLVAAAARLAAPPSERVTVIRNDATDYFADGMREQVDRHLGRLPKRDPHMRVVVALVVDTSATLAGAPVARGPGSWSADAFLPSDGRDPVCTVVVRAFSRELLSPPNPARHGASRRHFYEFDHDMLGPCAWYAAYGLPSASIRAWLDSTDHAPVSFRYGMLLIAPAVRSAQSQAWTPPNSIFEGWLGRYIPRDYGAASCAAGRIQHCTALMAPSRGNHRFDPARDILPGRAHVGRRYDPSLDGSFSLASMLALQFEREVGATGFTAFWTNPSPMPAAFHAVRGVPLDEWVHAHMEAFTRGHHAGPFPRTPANFSLLVTIPALLAIGIVARKHGYGGRA